MDSKSTKERPRLRRGEPGIRSGGGVKARSASMQAALLTLAPVLIVAARTRPEAPSSELPVIAGAAACAAITALGGVLWDRSPRWAASMATAGVVGAFALAFPSWSASPIEALSWIVIEWGVIVFLWRGRPLWNQQAPLQGSETAPLERSREGARSAALMSLAILAFFIAGIFHPDTTNLGAATVSLGVSYALGIRWVVASWPLSWRDLLVLGLSITLTCLGVAWSGLSPLSSLAWAAAGPLALLLVARAASSGVGWVSLVIELLVASPARLMVATFLGISFAGSLLLALPASDAGGNGIGLFDAAFTAVSAVCVTGLIVLDTPRDFTPLGQAVIMVLIQTGGLGIMTFSTAALAVLGRRMSLRTEGAMAELVSSSDRSDLIGAIRRILVMTLVCEALGALVLTAAFVARGEPLGSALWQGSFTAVSAFCNAGFALRSDSLIGYQTDHLVIHTIALLIVAGGLSPAVTLALPALVRRQRVGLQSRLALIATAALLLGGVVAYLALEWSHSLQGMTLLQRLSNAWFQSVTLRTAGFNSVDFANLRPATITLMLVWMFIGGSPGGTAGGIKTTTAAVLSLSILGAVRGRWQATAFGRQIPHDTVIKAAIITMVGALVAICGLIALQLTQRIDFMVALFEVVSALGTVGLSLGGTAALDQIGKVIIMVCMFVGRVGPLTIFLFLSDRKPPPSWGLPEERVDVG